MPRRRPQVCTQPGCPSIQAAPRCPTHQREYDAKYRQTGSKASEPRDRARRKAVVDAHRAAHGDWCPGFNRPAHASADLTADHVIEVAYGGHPHGLLQVLCRSCNSSKKVAAAHRDGIYQ